MAWYLGFTAFADTEGLHAVIQSGHFDAVLRFYSLLNPSAGRAMPLGFMAYDYGNLIGLAQEKGMGVLNIRVLAARAIVGQDSRGPDAGLLPGSDAIVDLRRFCPRARPRVCSRPGP